MIQDSTNFLTITELTKTKSIKVPKNAIFEGKMI